MDNSNIELRFLEEAVAFAREGVEFGHGGPFGCIIVRDGKVVGRGNNQVTATNDPTAHAEVVAIRDACGRLGSWQLADCDVYTSCEPCPMCLGALYWARPRRVIYASTRYEAAEAGFDDDFIYKEINLGGGKRKIPFIGCSIASAQELFAYWKIKDNRTLY